MVTRRQSAVLVADVVGYTSMMAADEIGTHDRIRSILDGLVKPALERFDGRMVKTMGDGMLLDFAEAVNAVECAAGFQGAVQTSPIAQSGGGAMEFRIGINLGDIIVEDGDIFGTPVNVASRLETLAEPGGIAVSGSTYWNIKDKTDIQFEEMGFLNLKNIPYPIEVYRIVIAGHDRPVEQMAHGDAGEAKPIKVWSEESDHLPSIVVLPFDNLSQDAQQDYFCDGLTQDLTTDLGRFSNLAVVSSNSAFSYKGKRAPVDQLRDELGAEYVVAGAVQRAADQVRINVQLHETKSGRQVWAERFHGDVADLFALQDEVVGRIVASLASKLTIVERDRAAHKETDSINSYEAFLKGLHFMTNFLGSEETQETLERCRYWLEHAVELDQDYARPWGWLAYYHVQSWLHGWSDDEALDTARKLAAKAVALDPSDHDTHWALGSVLFNSGQFDQARTAYERALDLNINDADLHAEMAEMLSYTGDHLEAISRVKFAMHLNPHFPEWYRWVLGWCLYYIHDYDEAIAELAKILTPSNEVLLIIAASHAQVAAHHESAERSVEAAASAKQASVYMDRFLERRPDWTLEKQQNLTRVRDSGDLKHWLQGLERAGLPIS